MVTISNIQMPALVWMWFNKGWIYSIIIWCIIINLCIFLQRKMKKHQFLSMRPLYLNKSCLQMQLFVVIVSFTGDTKYEAGDFTQESTSKEISHEKCYFQLYWTVQIKLANMKTILRCSNQTGQMFGDTNWSCSPDKERLTLRTCGTFSAFIPKGVVHHNSRQRVWAGTLFTCSVGIEACQGYNSKG